MEAGMRYWISFDLGIRGNYASLYEWLDRYKAKECGESVATFLSEKTRDQIVQELKKVVDMDTNPRIYIIVMKQGGKFVLGHRKVPPWLGHAQEILESGEER
jgi:hypothetical protein